MENVTDKVQNIKVDIHKWRLSFIDTRIQYRINMKNGSKNSFKGR